MGSEGGGLVCKTPPPVKVAYLLSPRYFYDVEPFQLFSLLIFSRPGDSPIANKSNERSCRGVPGFFTEFFFSARRLDGRLINSVHRSSSLVVFVCVCVCVCVVVTCRAFINRDWSTEIAHTYTSRAHWDRRSCKDEPTVKWMFAFGPLELWSVIRPRRHNGNQFKSPGQLENPVKPSKTQ